MNLEMQVGQEMHLDMNQLPNLMNYAKVGFQPFFTNGMTHTVWVTCIFILFNMSALMPRGMTHMVWLIYWLKTLKVNKSPAADSTCKTCWISKILNSQLPNSLKCCQYQQSTCHQFKCHQSIWCRVIGKFTDRGGVTNFVNKWNFVTNFHLVTNTAVTIFINTTYATARISIVTESTRLPWTGTIISLNSNTATKWPTTEKSKNWSFWDASDDSKIDKITKSKFKVQDKSFQSDSRKETKN